MADELLIKDLRAKTERGQVIAIVGAGVSTGATDGNPLASWTGLLDGREREVEALGGGSPHRKSPTGSDP